MSVTSSTAYLPYSKLDASNLANHQHLLASASRFQLEGNPLDRKALSVFFQIVTNKQSVKELDFSACPIGTDGLELLAKTLPKMPNIQSLSVRTIQAEPRAFISLFRALNGLLFMEHLNVSHDRFDEAASKALAETLSSCPSLSSLDLHYCEISKENLDLIIEAIGTCKNLRDLNMDSLLSLNAEGLRKLGKAVQQIPLERLNLDFNRIDTSSLKSFLPSLHSHPTLKEISLNMNPLRSKAAPIIATLLQENSTLQTLNLFGVDLGSEGGPIVAEALSKNTTLLHLNLHANYLGDEGAISLSKALRENKTLQSLNLEHNHITDVGGRELEKALQQTALSSINLTSNEFSSELKTTLTTMSCSAKVTC